MKKAISSFVATVLLIGFTVAVGAILSVWFTTFTRTQTAAVQSGAACTSIILQVSAINLNDGILVYRVTNPGPYKVNITSVIFSCDAGSWVNNTYSTSPTTIDVSSSVVLVENTSAGAGSECTEKQKISIKVSGRCLEIGGTTEGDCPETACFGP
jgi:archaellum component FlaF (FlaF/FlaG flagellin family)